MKRGREATVMHGPYAGDQLSVLRGVTQLARGGAPLVVLLGAAVCRQSCDFLSCKKSMTELRRAKSFAGIS